MQPSLYIFDLDGTLIDSFADIAFAVNQTLTQMSLPTLTHHQIKAHVGLGARWLLRQCLQEVGATSESALQHARTLFLPIYTEHLASETKIYPGVRETLDTLQNQGKTLTVCTNKPIALTHPLLRTLELDSFFVEVLGGDSLPTKKPDPAPLLLLMEKCQMTPSETWMIGDSRFDIEAGRAADVHTCGVTYGHHSLSEMQALRPNTMIHTFGELLT